jgi:hypothetical protein
MPRMSVGCTLVTISVNVSWPTVPRMRRSQAMATSSCATRTSGRSDSRLVACWSASHAALMTTGGALLGGGPQLLGNTFLARLGVRHHAEHALHAKREPENDAHAEEEDPETGGRLRL